MSRTLTPIEYQVGQHMRQLVCLCITTCALVAGGILAPTKNEAMKRRQQGDQSMSSDTTEHGH